MEQVLNIASAIGFSEQVPVNFQALKPLPEVRDMCAANRCNRFKTSWSCPPACGSLSDFAIRMQGYSRGVLVSTVGQLQDDFDLVAIRDTEALQKKRFDTLIRQLRHLYPNLFAMSCGTCTRCAKCTYPDNPCRYPDRLYPSMEACGLMVSDLCNASGMTYCHGSKTVTFISCVLF